jgi:hypothetical protein
MKAVKLDSVLSRQVFLLNEAAKEAKANNQRLLEAELNLISYQIRGTQTNATELINSIALPYFFGGDYAKADSAAAAYAQIAPDSIYGHYWSALSRERIDTAMAQGLAIAPYQRVLDIAATDKVRFKSQGVRAAQTLAIYHYNIKNDKAAAATFVQRGLEFDPSNANLLNIQGVLSRPTTPPKSSTPAKEVKVKTSGTKTKVKAKS